MSLELYEVKKCFSVEPLAEREKITCVTGYSGNLFLGTSTGKVYHYVREGRTWNHRASLEVPENSPIVHLISASALNLLLVLSDSTLFYVDIDGFLITAVGGSKTVNCIALNCSPTNDDPFVLQIAIGTRQKQVLLCERKDEQTVDISEKLSTDSTVMCISYSRSAVCFATEQSYFVHNARTKVTHPLFPCDAAVMRPIITNVGVEEFVLNGMQGLAVFVTGDGISQRAPIFMASNDVRSIQYSSPFLYALADKSLKVFSLSDQQMKQSVASKNAEMMDNIDGWLVVVTADEVDELAPVSIETQIEDALSARDLKKALMWMNEYASQFGNDARVTLKLRRCRQKAAFLAFAEGRLDTTLDQLVDAEADPRELLSLITDLQPTAFIPDDELRQLLDGKSPGFELDFVERYLRRIRPFAWAKPYMKTIESALFRIYALSDRLQELAELDASHWNNDDSRAWLLSQDLVNLSAEFAFEAGSEVEAMELWRMLATGEKKDDSFVLDSCFERISRLSNKTGLLSALAWLAPLNPAMTFEYLQNNNLLTLSDSEAFDVFAEYPELVIRVAEERMQTSPDHKELHTRLASAYVDALRNNTQNNDVRQKFRNFLFDSEHVSVEELKEMLRNDPSFRVEKLLLEAKSDAENSLRQILLIDGEHSVSAAELLCARLNATDPNLLRILLDSYLRLASKDEAMRHRLPKLLDQLESDADPTEVLRQIPQDVPAAEVTNFLQRTFAHATSHGETLRLRDVLARKAIDVGTQKLSTRSSISFRIDDDTKCGLCGQPLGREDFVRHPHSDLLAHQRCHAAR